MDEPTSTVDQPAADDPGAKAPQSSKLFAIIVAVAVLACAAAGAWLAYSQFARVDQVATALWPSDEPAADTTGAVDYGAFTEFQNLVVNPAATDGTRYLAVSVGFEAATPEVLDELKAHEIVVRDAILHALGQRTVAELSVVAQRDTLKHEIRTTVNGILQGGEVDRLYFTQFVLQ